jgi:hypothetical protein
MQDAPLCHCAKFVGRWDITLEVIKDLPAPPDRSAELIELEKRYGGLSAQRSALEIKLRGVETHMARWVMADEAETDKLAEQLASGEIDRISLENLPAQAAQLRVELNVIRRSEAKLWPILVRHRERHNNLIVKTYRPLHKQAVQRIARALQALIAANKAELELRKAVPVPLLAMAFPNVGGSTVNEPGSAKLWLDFAKARGFFEPEPAPEPPPKTRRGLLGRAKANGTAAEPASLAAKGRD